MAEKLTDKLARDAEPPARSNKIIYDESVTGFGLRVTAAGARAFILNYRRRTDGVERRFTIGSYPDWSVAGAREEARKLKRLVDVGGDPVGELRTARAAATMDDLCNRFLRDHCPKLRPITQRDYRLMIEHTLRPTFGKMKVEAVTLADVDAWHRKRTKDAPIQANRALGVLSRMLTLASRWGLRMGANPCKGIERNPEGKRVRYLTPDETARLSAALDAHSNRDAVDAIRLMLLTGSRKGETLASRWDDFDLVAGKWVKPGATTKQKTVHIVPLSAPAVQLLTARQRTSDYVFPGRSDGHRDDLTTSWKAVCKAARITNLRLHDLRHSYASMAASSGASLPMIGALLGHTQPQTTARYAHLFDDPLRAATELVAAKIAGQTGGRS